MRIIIDLENNTTAVVPRQMPENADRSEAADGGAPDASLMEAIDGSADAHPSRGGIDGGGPPASLVEVLHDPVMAATHTPNGEEKENAGAAPFL